MVKKLLIAALFLGGCYYQDTYAQPRTTVGVGVYASTPDLVAVGPGVSVIADYDEPIFYADGLYWWNYNGYWYRSSYYTGGWVMVSSPPIVVARIGSPYYYRHYRPSGYVARSRPVPYHRVQRPAYRSGGGGGRAVIRDHRR